MQRFSATKPARPLTATIAAALMLLASACSDGSTLADGTTSTEDSSQTTDDGAGTATTGDGTVTTDDDDGDGTTVSDGDSADGGSDDGTGADPEPIPGLCSVDEVNRQPFYAVANIDDDDPDGGLNVRDNYENGDKLATLPEGSVVLAYDCFRRDDGAVWFAIETEDTAGWVNAAYLGTEISPLEPTFGGNETAAKVEAVLDALAARDWEAAAAELTLTDSEYSPLEQQLETGDDLAARLEAYCQSRVCDAPYTITAIRGSYMPERIRPSVDVEFVYSGGLATETFAKVQPEADLSLDALPGRSVLAYRQSLPPVADLVAQPSADDSGLYDAAETVRQALLAENGPSIPDDYVPAEGIAISVDAYVDPVVGNRNIVTADDLAAGGDQVRIWGFQDGVGTPIVQSLDQLLADYRRSIPLLQPDEVGIDERVGLGNTIANLGEVFPGARVVEFHRRGRGELSDFNWSSVRLAFEQRGDDWKLLAITGDTWTI